MTPNLLKLALVAVVAAASGALAAPVPDSAATLAAFERGVAPIAATVSAPVLTLAQLQATASVSAYAKPTIDPGVESGN
ncbi:hypothetical protein BD413DRAFT_613844 [Trametes elegans]|nr:hypothetical protein BD413DRAFT_613844 [Trametes elegans]